MERVGIARQFDPAPKKIIVSEASQLCHSKFFTVTEYGMKSNQAAQGKVIYVNSTFYLKGSDFNEKKKTKKIKLKIHCCSLGIC